MRPKQTKSPSNSKSSTTFPNSSNPTPTNQHSSKASAGITAEVKSPIPPIAAPRPQASNNKIPWSGIAAGAMSSHPSSSSSIISSSNTNPPMSFASAAAQSIHRTTTPNSSSSLRSGSLTRTSASASIQLQQHQQQQQQQQAILRSSRSGAGAIGSSLASSPPDSIANLNHKHLDEFSISSSATTTSNINNKPTKNGESTNTTSIDGKPGLFTSPSQENGHKIIPPSAHDDGGLSNDGKLPTSSVTSNPELELNLDPESQERIVAEVLRSNSSGRKYELEEILDVFSVLKKSNVIKPSSEPRQDLYFSVTPNDPAILDHQHHQQQQLLLNQQQQQQQPHQSSLLSSFGSNQQSSSSFVDLHRTNSSLLSTITTNESSDMISSMNNSTVNSAVNSPMISSSQLHSQHSIYTGFTNTLTASKTSLDFSPDPPSSLNQSLASRSSLLLDAVRVGSPAPGSSQSTNTTDTTNANNNVLNSSWSPFVGNATINGSGSAASALSSTNANGTDISSNTIGSTFLNGKSATNGIGGGPISGISGIPSIPSVPPGVMNTPLGANTPPPPGMGLPMLIPPEQIQWVYKDMAGNEQGPFNGLLMQEWFSKNWFISGLLIRRAEEIEYYTLKDYIIRVNNNVKPFLVSLPPVKVGGGITSPSSFYDQQQQQQQRTQDDAFARQREAYLKLQLQQQQQQLASLQQFQQQQQQPTSGWGSMSPATGPISPMSPWVQSQARLQAQGQQPLGGFVDQPSNSGIASASTAPSAFGFGALTGSQVNLAAHLNNDPWQQRNPGSIPHTPRRIPSIGNLNENTTGGSIGVSGLGASSATGNNNLSGSGIFGGNSTSVAPVHQLNLQSEVVDANEESIGNPISEKDPKNSKSLSMQISPPPVNAAIQPPNKSPLGQFQTPETDSGRSFALPKTQSPISTSKPEVQTENTTTLVESAEEIAEKLAAVEIAISGKPVPDDTFTESTENLSKTSKIKSGKKDPVSSNTSKIPSPIAEAFQQSVKPSPVSSSPSPPAETYVSHIESKPVVEDAITYTADAEEDVEEETQVDIDTAPSPAPAPAKPVLAPWATKEATKPKPLSLKEIQEIESAERKTRKAQQQAAAAVLQASRASAASAASSGPALPSGATWASVGTSTSSAPKKTLAQIQKEEEEASKRRHSAASIANSAANVAAAAAAASSASASNSFSSVGAASSVSSSATLGSGSGSFASIATGSANSPNTNGLSSAVNVSSTSSNVGSNSASSILSSSNGISASGVRRYADIATTSSGSGNSLASRSTLPSTSGSSTSSSSSGTATGGAWTTVGPGGKKVSSGTSSSSATSSSTTGSSGASSASIASFRKAELSRSSTIPVSSVSSISLGGTSSQSKISTASEEFLNWCKSSLIGLNSGVNRTELLSMLLSLPASGESKEIIADTIYSNSTTMDGRRFADEFIKRRINADSVNNSSGQNGDNWSDILSRSSTTVSSTVPSKSPNDGWNVPFKVVGKKKNRRE